MYEPSQKDETLVMLTLAGDSVAFETLVVRWQNAVNAAAYSVLHSRWLAEDAAQDAFITAWMKLNVLREPAKFGVWVCRIAKNCALNTVSRYQSYLSLDAMEALLPDDAREDPQNLLAESEDSRELRKSIESLPDQVKRVVKMHYFEELSVEQIAGRLQISESTVKWHLHDGRKRMRKELCAMDEKMNDNLVQKVMKKVEELRLWRLKNRKDGFEKVYRSVLSEVEELPESMDKYHALADVLMQGWWWLPGKKNDSLLERLQEAAEKGKNEEVMEFFARRQVEKLWKMARIEGLRDQAIPELEQKGFPTAAAHLRVGMGCLWFKYGEAEQGTEAVRAAREHLPPSDPYYALSLAAEELQSRKAEWVGDVPFRRYDLVAAGVELRRLDGEWRFWDRQSESYGSLYAMEHDLQRILESAATCDRRFRVPGLAVGESYVGTDGSTLTYADSSATLDSPAGHFEGCQVWITDRGSVRWTAIYKEGIGLLSLEKAYSGIRERRTLVSYTVTGGNGILPMSSGNRWEYSCPDLADSFRRRTVYTVIHADGQTATLTELCQAVRLKYDENVWLDMIEEIRGEYWNTKDGKDDGESGEHIIQDVSHAIERAKALAVTPMEKAHTEAACSVARRIMDTDGKFTPGRKAEGLWNFFNREAVTKKDGRIILESNFRWNFEWKGWVRGMEPICCNDVYAILQDAAGCVWSDEWRPDAEPVVEYQKYGRQIRTKISCAKAGEVVTPAGRFDGCLQVTLDVEGMTDGMAYRGDRKVYFFAPGVGIVRTENHWQNGRPVTVYLLTDYVGTGEGYMPMADGLTRRYEAKDLTDGFVATADYTYVSDGMGGIVIFADRLGNREKLRVTRYETVLGEVEEDRLWDEGKQEECRIRAGVNQIALLLHMEEKNSWAWAIPERAAVWGERRLRLLDSVRVDGRLPRAWWGLYAESVFRMACYLFGCDRKEDGYKMLDFALNELYPNWLAIPDGELLEFGDENLFCGIKYAKGDNQIVLPDGSREPTYNNMLTTNPRLPYYGMTAPHGWEWFNAPRNDERFKAAIETARKLIK